MKDNDGLIQVKALFTYPTERIEVASQAMSSDFSLHCTELYVNDLVGEYRIQDIADTFPLKVSFLKVESFSYLYGWTLGVAEFKEKPMMVFKGMGHEHCAKLKRYIVDEKVYREFIDSMQAYRKQPDNFIQDHLVSMDDFVDCGFLGSYLQPKGEIL